MSTLDEQIKTLTERVFELEMCPTARSELGARRTLAEVQREKQLARRAEEEQHRARSAIDDREWQAFIETDAARSADPRLIEILVSERHHLCDMARSPLADWTTKVVQSRVCWRGVTREKWVTKEYPPRKITVEEPYPGTPNANTKRLVMQARDLAREELRMTAAVWSLLLEAMLSVTPAPQYGMSVAL